MQQLFMWCQNHKQQKKQILYVPKQQKNMKIKKKSLLHSCKSCQIVCVYGLSAIKHMPKLIFRSFHNITSTTRTFQITNNNKKTEQYKIFATYASHSPSSEHLLRYVMTEEGNFNWKILLFCVFTHIFIFCMFEIIQCC